MAWHGLSRAAGSLLLGKAYIRIVWSRRSVVLLTFNVDLWNRSGKSAVWEVAPTPWYLLTLRLAIEWDRHARSVTDTCTTAMALGLIKT